MRSVRKILLGAVLLTLLTGLASAQNATDGAKRSPSLQVPEKPRPARPTTYGTTAISYIEVPANAFLPWNSGQTWTTDDFGRGPRWSTGGGTDFVAPLHLPAGAFIVYLEIDYVDNNAADTVFGSLTVCDFTGNNCTYHPAAGGGPVDCAQAGFVCSGYAAMGTNGFGVDISGDGIVVDNFFGSYSLLAEPTATDGSTKVGGMIVGYVLQVSPAPGTATFTDVPTSHPQFRFVEALVAAGITAGCGSGNYCPDNPLTRGQMAVYLATALGLQWN